MMLHVIRGQKISQECGWMLACPVPTLDSILILAIWYTICHLHHLHDALPGLNVFTGTDFKSSIMNKGNVKALEVMDVLAKLVESTKILCGLMFCVAERHLFVLYMGCLSSTRSMMQDMQRLNKSILQQNVVIHLTRSRALPQAVCHHAM